jgi:hypothetical protein
MLQAAHVPTAGALHEAPVSTFFLAALFFCFSEPSAGADISTAQTKPISRDFGMFPPLHTSESENLLLVLRRKVQTYFAPERLV